MTAVGPKPSARATAIEEVMVVVVAMVAMV